MDQGYWPESVPTSPSGEAILYDIHRDFYTQLTDVEREINELMTNDWKPKFDVAAVRRINEMLK